MRISWRSLTIASLGLAGTLESQLLRPMTRDELWKRGVAASRAATSPRCAQNDWVYVETLLYFFAWYQNARPTNPEEARKFERDFNNKVKWTEDCLKISNYSSAQMRDTSTKREPPPPPDTASFFAAPPQAEVPPQTDALGRTVPQLLELLANRDATINERDAAIRERDQRIAALQQEYDTVVRSAASVRAARAAGHEEEGYMCTIQSKASGLWWAATMQGQGIVTRPIGQQSTFGLIPGEDGKGRAIMSVPTQLVLIARENSSQVTLITKDGFTDAEGDLLGFHFFLEPSGLFRIHHWKTNRWLTDAGGVISLIPNTQREFAPNDPNGLFLLNC